MATNSLLTNTIFIELFNNEQKALEVYNSIFNSNYKDFSKIKFYTLNNKKYLLIKNNLSFIVENKLVVLSEYLVTISSKELLKELTHTAILYEEILNTDKSANIHTVELIIFHNDTKGQPLKKILRLSDNFKICTDNNSFEIKVKIVNIKYEIDNQILLRNTYLNDYSLFICKVQNYIKQNMDKTEAIKLCIKECIDENTSIREFLIENNDKIINSLSIELLTSKLIDDDEETTEEYEEKSDYKKFIEKAKWLSCKYNILLAIKAGIPFTTALILSSEYQSRHMEEFY